MAPAIKALFLCLFFGGAAVGYVWQQRKLHDLDVLQRTLEARLELLKRDNRVAMGQLADLQLPYRLQERVRQMRINLAPAVAAQLVRLPEPAFGFSPPALSVSFDTRRETASAPPRID